jgi:CP12 domain
MSDIQERIVQQRDQARECEVDGGDCAPEWDALEELQSELSHQRAKAEEGSKNSLQQYCDENPDAAECRLYED